MCAWSTETLITLCDGGKLLGSFRRLVFDPPTATFALPPSLVAQREKWPCFISVSQYNVSPLLKGSFLYFSYRHEC